MGSAFKPLAWGARSRGSPPLLWVQTRGWNLSIPKQKEAMGWKDVSMPSPLFPSQPVTALRPVGRSVPTNLRSRSATACLLLPPRILRKPEERFPTAAGRQKAAPRTGRAVAAAQPAAGRLRGAALRAAPFCAGGCCCLRRGRRSPARGGGGAHKALA